jgi:hypothetical protein
LPIAESVSCEPISAGNIRAEWIVPEGASERNDSTKLWIAYIIKIANNNEIDGFYTRTRANKSGKKSD